MYFIVAALTLNANSITCVQRAPPWLPTLSPPYLELQHERKAFFAALRTAVLRWMAAVRGTTGPQVSIDKLLFHPDSIVTRAICPSPPAAVIWRTRVRRAAGTC